jgi:hypothetical protein
MLHLTMQEKIFLRIIVLLLITIHTSAQTELMQLMPGSVSGGATLDEPLMNRALLVKQGIRKITSQQGKPVNTKTFSMKTVDLDGSGNPLLIVLCFQKEGTNDTAFCIRDRYIYNDSGKILSVTSMGVDGIYNQVLAEDSSKDVRRILQIAKRVPGDNNDTSILYEQYNTKGQVVKRRQKSPGMPDHTVTIKYNDDSLPESIVYNEPSYVGYTFNRSMKRGKKIISLKTDNVDFEWVYNATGQCLSFSYLVYNSGVADGKARLTGGVKTVVEYQYDQSGLISKVVEKGSNKLVTTMLYTYSR